jgi:protease-4
VFWGGLLLILYCLGAALWDRAADSGSNPLGREYIAVINVEGFIGDTEKSLAWIERLARDKKVKGALLRVNSPGGGAAASRELHDALKRLAEAKPLYASMGSVAASGGLMAASAATRVFANPSTITGSIGVKMEIPQVQGLMEKLGLRRESLASGRYKDAGTPFRPMTPEERAYLADIVEDMHRQFVALLCRDRNIPEEKLLPVADGRILTGAKALELGLVDELGGRDEALRRLRAAAGVTEDAPLLEQPRKGHFLRGLLESLLGADSGFGPLVPEFLHLY